MKECKECEEIKPINEFGKSGSYNGVQLYRARCKNCYNNNWKYRIIGNITSHMSKRYRPDGSVIKKKTTNKTVTLKFLEDLKVKQKGKCFWLGIDIDFSRKDALRKPSLDRLDNSIGYEADNVVLTTLFANRGRCDADIKQIKQFVNDYL